MKKTLFIIAFLLVVTLNAQGKDVNYYLIDSLDLSILSNSDRELLDSSLNIYHNAKHDTERVNALYYICEGMLHQDWEKYQFFQDSLITDYLSKKVSQNVRHSLQEAQSACLNNLGIIYNNRGQSEIALSYYKQSLQLDIKLNDKFSISTSLNNIANIYQNQGNIEKALKYYHKSLEIAEKIGYEEGQALGLNNIAYNHLRLNDFDKAHEFFN